MDSDHEEPHGEGRLSMCSSNGDVVGSLRSAVEAVLRRMVGMRDPDYEDLVQSCIEHVLEAMNTGAFRGDCRQDQWAAKIARNVAVDAIRARTRDRKLFARDTSDELLRGRPGPDLGPDRLLEMRRHLSSLQEALAGVSRIGAEVVYLHDVLGHELREVAALIGVSTATAHKRLKRGRRKIAETLKRDSAFSTPTSLASGVTRKKRILLSRNR